jgi:hypothetical protein
MIRHIQVLCRRLEVGLTYHRTWTSSGGAEIDYYEVELRSFTKQIYPDLPATPMVGYDGMSPGPTFIMQQNRGEGRCHWCLQELR